MTSLGILLYILLFSDYGQDLVLVHKGVKKDTGKENIHKRKESSLGRGACWRAGGRGLH